MDSLFPEWFFLSFFITGVVRVVIALVFLYDAKKLLRLSGTEKILGIKAGAIGLALGVGVATQGIAIIGILYALYVAYKKIQASVFANKITAFLAIAILLLLAVGGAGGWAFDRPY
ncbi:hypothetical protein A2841_03290 [Candidatus Kaiserbacteria bacterium RIFCSPHIGHO2_01_FULL_48_10]|uniref:Uncharacterized protein n=1 Tax=Candidatus Kaiserbacteria bacterium RIFCSPHIGHO2_01_FULL_48_10 TaxID=1798476 RepID=A0A1F6C3X6_9BACT|nr:MAG: hypothetical protein A2841_03290 [Candidatus Kaiserbacteria bacterium RIFCSPHIGHO2_01_FULL_48_10]